MSDVRKLAIPTEKLPKDWREKGARKFRKSQSTIEKVVYGLRENTEILAFMLELAEAHVETKEETELQLKARLEKLNAAS